MSTRADAETSGEAAGDDPLREIGIGLGTATVGFASYVAWFVVLSTVAVAARGELTEVQNSMLNPPALALGMTTGAGIYFQHSRHDASFLDVRVPTLRELLYALGGFLGLLATNLGVEYALSYFGIPSPEHGTVELISSADPIVLLYFVVASILLVGPAEELLFRNVIQKRFEEFFSPASATAIASLVFALVHFSAYYSTDPLQFAASLATVLLLALLLGWIFHRTRNVVVVALAHGCYNGILFATLYL